MIIEIACLRANERTRASSELFMLIILIHFSKLHLDLFKEATEEISFLLERRQRDKAEQQQ